MKEFSSEQWLEMACTVGFNQQFPAVQSMVMCLERNRFRSWCSVKKQSGCSPYQGLYGVNMHC